MMQWLSQYVQFLAFIHSTTKHDQALASPQQRTNPTGVRVLPALTAQHVLDSFAGPEPGQSSPYGVELSHVQQDIDSRLRNWIFWASILFQRKLFTSYKAVAVSGYALSVSLLLAMFCSAKMASIKKQNCTEAYRIQI